MRSCLAILVLCIASALLLLSLHLSFVQNGAPALHGMQASNSNRELKSMSFIRLRAPKIYIYNTTLNNHSETGKQTAQFYGLDQLLQDLIKESPYVTTNPEEADFFLPDFWWYYTVSTNRLTAAAALKHYSQSYPWMNRTMGKDHLMVITDDMGRCSLPNTAYTRNFIVIQLFGRVSIHNDNPVVCDLSKVWGSVCDREMLTGEAYSLKNYTHKVCHIPYQDIVVPTTAFEMVQGEYFTRNFDSPYIHPANFTAPRNKTFFYSGKIDLHHGQKQALTDPWTDAGYSMGVRQTIYRMFKNIPGFHILTHHTHETYWQLLAQSIFCLAPAGWGWGGRMKVAVTRGCIPVIIQDGIKVEWEDVLPLPKYAIRMPLWMAHKLPQILKSFQARHQVPEMQKVLSCVWRLHWWHRPHGRAFEVLMCELKRRLHNASAIRIDFEACTIYCGDDIPVSIVYGINSI